MVSEGRKIRKVKRNLEECSNAYQNVVKKSKHSHAHVWLKKGLPGYLCLECT